MIIKFRTPRTRGWAIYSTKQHTSKAILQQHSLTPLKHPGAIHSLLLASHLNCARTWGLRIIDSTNIYVYGAGLYNFFNNWYADTCLAADNCQYAMIDFQNSTDCYIWTLSTVASEYMVSWENTPLVPQQVNKATFTESILVFEMVKNQ